ncbi:MAG TPA: hypothetical protein VJS39_09910 [Gemmatimonadaceae bacterium]|nr:hypothetical protein [Gemmatimonadaceae bacterium]
MPFTIPTDVLTTRDNQRQETPAATPVFGEWHTRSRRTPRKSLIVVVPENHHVPTDTVTERLGNTEAEEVDVILACAGQPTGIGSLQRKVRDLQVLLAPAGTSDEDLRELAMHLATGDIVTLLNGSRPGG